MGSPTVAKPTPKASISVGDVIGVFQKLEENRGLIEGIVKFIMRLFGKKTPPPVPAVPVKVPTPRDDSPDDFPDDTIPTPVTKVKIGRVRLKLARAQYQKARFPEQYTPDNPMGLYSQADLDQIEQGKLALNWGSKFWLDITAWDEFGRELTRDRVLAEGLAYKTEFHFGDAFIVGSGQAADGGPTAGYKTNDTNEIGNGDSAWRSSLGFLHQMKSHVDAGGKLFHVSAKLDGIPTNEFDVAIN